MERNMSALTSTSSCQGAHGTAEVIEPLLAPSDDPPPFTLTVIDEGLVQALGNGAGPSKTEDMEPPAYDVAIKLPTYEEAQQEKMIAEQQHRYPHSVDPRLAPPGPGNYNFMSPFAHPVGAESQFDANTAELALGTDVYFFASFLIAFLFNWIGFLLLMCACHTVAGRYGALAGFGLSLAKWTLIVKHSTDLASNDNNWLWWLIMAFGVLICVRAVIQYLCIKREWHRLSRAAQERVVFFY